VVKFSCKPTAEVHHLRQLAFFDHPLAGLAMIFTTLDNFYVSKEDLADSPSRKDGISADTERDQRIYGCELIQEAGILLRLPQAVMATGQVLLHRFYCKVSLVAHDVKVRVALPVILLLQV